MSADARNRRVRLDPTSLLGVPVGVGLILVGQALEGGGLHSLLQVPAALIVFGGTCGAVLFSFPVAQVLSAIRAVPAVFVDPLEPATDAVGRIVKYAAKARRSGVMSIEDDIEREPDPFLLRALRMAVDGVSQSRIRAALEVENDTRAEADEEPARVFEAAGGYAPTIGIIGAVLGLIHVMENLTEPAKLGPGIAVAFVATVYGVGSANLILLPIAARLRERGRAAARRREMLLDGVLAIQDGLNPRLVEGRLQAFEPGMSIAAPVSRFVVRTATEEHP
jgi:chemotaxis protein MotA